MSTLTYTFCQFNMARFLSDKPAADFKVSRGGEAAFHVFMAPEDIQRNIKAGEGPVEELKKGLKAYDLHGVETA